METMSNKSKNKKPGIIALEDISEIIQSTESLGRVLYKSLSGF